MRRVVEVVTGVANSASIPMDHRAQFFNVGIEVLVSATATYNVQYTLDDIYNPLITPTWFNVTTTIPVAGTTFVGASANAVGNVTVPCSAMRLNVTASTGTVTMTLLQSSGQG
jgi:hypothetical protein